MATVLYIDGVAVDRPAARVVVNRLNLSLDGFDSLEFTELAVRPPGAYTARKSCELVVDGATRFKGQVVSAYYSGIGRGPIDVGYRALGLEWLANRIQITASDGTGRLVYNLDSFDTGYVAANSGKSVGDILKELFDLHAAQLTAAGVVGYTAGDLTPLTAVPNEPVILTGCLWNAVRSLLAQWCNKYAAWIDPSDGKIYVRNLLTLTANTLTLDSDPIVVDSLSRDNSECFTSVVARGGADVQAAFLTLTKDATLVAKWTALQQSAWSYADFISPKDAADMGDVTAMTSTTLTVTSDSAATFWAVNYWGPIDAEVVAYDPAATGITFSESRRITSNTALSAGGSSVLTVDEPFNNSGYTRYSIRGRMADSALVFRAFDTTATYVAQHLVQRFSHAVPWSPQDGVVVQTYSPQALICWSPACGTPYYEWPGTFQIVPYDGVTNGYFVFDEPVVRPFGSMANLIAGGASVDGIPCEIKMLVPFSVGALSSAAPASGYEGTAYTADGLSNVLYRDFPSWTDYKDAGAMAILAQETLDTVKDTVIEGSLAYFGKYSAALSKGLALNLAAVGYTTGFEAAAAPIRSVTLDYAPDGGASKWITRIQFSNRMKPFSGDRLYTHPAFGGVRALGGGYLDPGAVAAAVAYSDATSDRPSDFQTPGAFGGTADQAAAALADFGGEGDPGAYRRRPARRLDGRSRLTRQVETERADAARRADRRRKAQAGSDASSGRLASIRGKRADDPVTSLSEALTGRGPVTAADVDADDRENRRRATARAAGRHAARLSNTLGDPTGRKRAGQSAEDYQSDRAVDAHLADLMKRDDDGAAGPGEAYQ